MGFSLQIKSPKQCTFVRIIQDDEIEGNEEFSIRLLTSDPIAVLVDSQANVTIVDDDGVSTTTPANANGIHVCTTASYYLYELNS